MNAYKSYSDCPFRLSQPPKISSTESVTVSKESQPLNVLLPMLVTDSGIVRFLKELQPLNALFPIVITELGIVRLMNELRSFVHGLCRPLNLEVSSWSMRGTRQTCPDRSW